MPLPILKTPVESDLIRLFHRMTLHYTQHLGETTPLDVGTAIANPQLSDVYDANVLLDAALPAGVSPADAVAMVNAHFTSVGCVWRSCVVNPSVDVATTKPLADYLLANGGEAVVNDVLYLAKQPTGAIRELPGLRIIPARASYKHARQLAEINARESGEGSQRVEALMLHLDDSHWDALLALQDGQPIASIGVLAVGDAGLIDDVYVRPEERHRGVGLTMMSRAMEICARSLFKHVMLSVLPDNVAGQALYAKLGFKKIGQFTAICPGGKPKRSATYRVLQVRTSLHPEVLRGSSGFDDGS
ncbi:hypothetical protein BH10PLA1_BH10PLA1_10710 [soil metagenome]